MVAAVIVLYNPHMPLLDRLLRSVVSQVGKIYVIDNTPGSNADNSSCFDQYQSSVEYLPLGENKGIATAQNIGIRQSMNARCSHVLLLDQDSALPVDMVNRLLAAEEELLNKGEKIAAMSPQVVDEKTGRRPCAVHYRWCRALKVFPDANSTQPVQTDNLIASGSLIRTEALLVLGTMRSDLFIEYVDTEWVLRAHASGYKSYCVPNAVMMHSFGDASIRIFGKDIYLYNDLRYYYKLRNAVYLARLRTMGWQWRAYILSRIPYHFVLYSVLSKNPLKASRFLLNAIRDGMLGRLGPLKQTSTRKCEGRLGAAREAPDK